MELGVQIIADVYKAMMIDAEWSVRGPNQFTWWGHRLAQRVTAEPPRLDEGFSIVRVTAVTDVLRDVEGSAEMLQNLAEFNSFATMGAYVWDPERKTVSLVSTVYAHDETARLATHLAKGFVAMQAAEAHIVVDEVTAWPAGRDCAPEDRPPNRAR